MARPGYLRSGRKLLLAAAIGLFLSAPAFAATDPLRVTKNANATAADLSPGRQYASPYLAADPNNPKVVVGATVDLTTRRCSAIFTTDGGVTWKQGQGSPAPNDYPYCVWSNFANQAAMGRNGRAYVAIAGWDDRDGGPRTGNMAFIVSSTDDLGKNWKPTIVQQVRGKDGENVEQHRPAAIAVDSKHGSDDIVYAAFLRLQPNKVAPNAEPTRPMFAVSTDGGKTFGAPIDLSKGVFNDALRQQSFSSATTTTLAPTATTTTTTAPAAGSRAATPNQDANFGGTNPRIALDDDGTIYVAWRNSTANLPANQPVAPSTLVSVSKDRGKTWTTNSVVNYTVGAASRLAWTKEGGPNGTLVMIFGRNLNPTANSGGDILIQRSTDQGKTWTEPQNITDDDPAKLVGQYIPTLSAAPNGRLDAAFYDVRDDPGIRGNDVYYTYSDDGGKTWSKNLRVSDQTINRNYGVWGFNYDVTPPIGVASTNELAVFAWDDTRNSEAGLRRGIEPGAGVQDIYAATVQHEVVGGGSSKATKVILAGLVGLAGVAIVLLTAAFVMRRGSPGPEKKAKAKAADKATAKV